MLGQNAFTQGSCRDDLTCPLAWEHCKPDCILCYWLTRTWCVMQGVTTMRRFVGRPRAYLPSLHMYVCADMAYVCMCACRVACVCACVRVCVWTGHSLKAIAGRQALVTTRSHRHSQAKCIQSSRSGTLRKQQQQQQHMLHTGTILFCLLFARVDDRSGWTNKMPILLSIASCTSSRRHTLQLACLLD